ncbi:MAG: arginine deiminase-related protein [Paludibacter sp.]|nr:arginine deiminase-related protein [Paludibacter sp.]
MQTTSTILMIEPVCFGFNEQTAANNYFQQNDNAQTSEIQANALKEFQNMVILLRKCGVNVIVVQDTAEPRTPDSIFPNNWISLHDGGLIAIYPMFALNRRQERSIEIIKSVENQGFNIIDIYDFSASENDGKFLEGTGSMVLDRVNRRAYAALSERTNEEILLDFCEKFNFTPVIFNAMQTVGEKRLPVYHTNVVMSVGDDFAVVCLQSIDNKDERNLLIKSILQTQKEIIEISQEQMHNFAGNMLQIENTKGEKLIALSLTAYNSLDDNQKRALGKYGTLLPVAIDTIEKYGGGSVRCMMAEVFCN